MSTVTSAAATTCPGSSQEARITASEGVRTRHIAYRSDRKTESPFHQGGRCDFDNEWRRWDSLEPTTPCLQIRPMRTTANTDERLRRVSDAIRTLADRCERLRMRPKMRPRASGDVSDGVTRSGSMSPHVPGALFETCGPARDVWIYGTSDLKGLETVSPRRCRSCLLRSLR